MKKTKPVLVTGATGYVGGRLVLRLLAEGYRVRAMARSIEKLKARPWANHPLIELCECNVLDRSNLKQAVTGCWAAYYLVHSMDPHSRDFSDADRRAAENMVAATTGSEMDRIIYLGGVTPNDRPLSHHLQSRKEVGEILRSGPVPVTILQAAMIMGSGSASFEIMRYLTDRLPVMIAPAWVRSQVQPICIRNVIDYLVGGLQYDQVKGLTFDIGGPDVLSYQELFQIYAEEAGLPRRWIIPVPFFSLGLSSYWIQLITPVHSSIARPLAEGMRNNAVCADNRIRTIIPMNLMTCRQTIQRILQKLEQQIVETCWTDAGYVLPYEWVHMGDEDYAGGKVISFEEEIVLNMDAEKVWESVIRIGGDTGWYYANFLWRLRGFIDKMIGGVGSERGRRHPSQLVLGDALDFWRVIEVRPPRRLLLMSEMKAPGEAVLDFQIIAGDGHQTTLKLIARFLPRGLVGLMYWYALLPFHSWIFKGMLNAMAQASSRAPKD